MQSKADICGIPILAVENSMPVLSGTAILGGVCAGIYENEKSAFSDIIIKSKLYEPRKQQKAFYEEGYHIYKELYPSLRNINRQIFERRV